MAYQLPVLDSEPGSSALRPDGGRNFIIPADVSGRYARRRQIIFALLIIPVFVQGPNDRQQRTVRLRVDDGSTTREVQTSFIAP